MNEHIDLAPQLPYSTLDPKSGMQNNGVAAPVAADRLYQFAALTAGLFLLFTLL
jgi:hypothetical protein